MTIIRLRLAVMEGLVWDRVKGGATQAEFWAPGAQSKYRLGNEANSYL
ncbi:carbohydrate porin [Bacteroidetes bacterium endosymbiont of Geopemphigus sp.]|nr:carbohydrate porin [Bacteroidetes bacterium endosymbiont of Geopemphigus sp.]